MTIHYQKHRFSAMGSSIQIWLEASQDDACRAFVKAESIFQQYEKIFSRFDANSELSHINREGGGDISAIFCEVLGKALQLAENTKGYYDPTLLHNLEQAGYNQSFKKHQVIESTREQFVHAPNSYQDVLLREDIRRLRLPDQLMLDLNGIVKGWTAQVVREVIRSAGACLIDAGGDVIAGDAPTGELGWLVGIAAPSNKQQAENDLFAIYLENETLATSGIDYRKWYKNDVEMHHLIDPFTGEPAQNQTETVTVKAESAASAEAWATAGCVMGIDIGLPMFEANNIAAYFSDVDTITVTSELRPHIVSTF